MNKTIDIHFFASIREALDCDQETLEVPEDVDSIAALIQWFGENKDPQWKEALQTDGVLVAINQVMVDKKEKFDSGDEVAFFPPVTGG